MAPESLCFLDEIGEMQGAGEAGGACADDQDVGFELFALDGHRLSNLSKAVLLLAELLKLIEGNAELL